MLCKFSINLFPISLSLSELESPFMDNVSYLNGLSLLLKGIFDFVKYKIRA